MPNAGRMCIILIITNGRGVHVHTESTCALQRFVRPRNHVSNGGLRQPHGLPALAHMQ